MPGFVDHIDAELAQLERELAADPRYVKVRELQRVRSLYVQDADRAEPPRSAVPPAIPLRRASKNSETVEAVIEHLSAHRSAPIKTSVILAQLEATGIEVGGQDPRNKLNAMMSHSGRFVSHGRQGWTLAETKGHKDTEAADATSPEKDAPTASVEPRLTTGGTTGWTSVWPQDSDRVDPRPGGWDMR